MSKEVKTGLMIGTAVVLLIVFVLTGGKLRDLFQPEKPDRPPQTDKADKADKPDDKGKTPPVVAKAGEYLFCFWNVENLFDDQDDGRRTKGDKEFDAFVAHLAAVLTKNKVAKDDADALLKIVNGTKTEIVAGKGN